MRLVDTNVLLYASSRLPEEADKRNRARKLLTEPDLAISVQVLQEFYHQATRLTRLGRLTHEDAMRFIEQLLSLPVQPITLDVFRTAVSISQRFGLSYWDGAILAAAHTLGCDAVYSEDLRRRPRLRRPAGDQSLSRRVHGAMTTDTSERGLERLICAALTGSPCDPGQAGAVRERPAGYGVGWICGDSRDYDRDHCVGPGPTERLSPCHADGGRRIPRPRQRQPHATALPRPSGRRDQ